MASNGTVVLTTDEPISQIPVFFAMAFGGFTIALIISSIANCLWKRFRKPEQADTQEDEEIHSKENGHDKANNRRLAQLAVNGFLNGKHRANGEITTYDEEYELPGVTPVDKHGFENGAYSSGSEDEIVIDTSIFGATNSSQGRLHKTNNRFKNTVHVISGALPATT